MGMDPLGTGDGTSRCINSGRAISAPTQDCSPGGRPLGRAGRGGAVRLERGLGQGHLVPAVPHGRAA